MGAEGDFGRAGEQFIARPVDALRLGPPETESVPTVDLGKIEQLIEAGFLRVREHPDYPLFVANAETKSVEARARLRPEYARLVSMARGIIYDGTGKIVALPFGQFEDIGPDTVLEEGNVRVTPKIDGTLGITYFAGGEFHMGTRTSFVDEGGRTRRV